MTPPISLDGIQRSGGILPRWTGVQHGWCGVVVPGRFARAVMGRAAQIIPSRQMYCCVGSTGLFYCFEAPDSARPKWTFKLAHMAIQHSGDSLVFRCREVVVLRVDFGSSDERALWATTMQSLIRRD
jgi:hypothetical protein